MIPNGEDSQATVSKSDINQHIYLNIYIYIYLLLLKYIFIYILKYILLHIEINHVPKASSNLRHNNVQNEQTSIYI